MIAREQHLYIPPDVDINEDDGTIADWEHVFRFNNQLDHYMISVTGLGMPRIEYIDESGPLQNGSKILDYRLEDRIIQYLMRVNGRCNRDSYWEKRALLLNSLRPNRQETGTFQSGRLRVVRPNGVTRDIEAIILQGPVFRPRNPSRWDEHGFTETLRFRCHDPTFFDPIINNVAWQLDVFKGWIFKSTSYPDNTIFGLNSIFGTEALSATSTITYTGTAVSYPIITIRGPVTSLSIENQTLDTKIQLYYDIDAGETVTIDTTYGTKSITNDAGDNLIGTQSSDSDLDLYIAPDPIAPDGHNVFIVTGSGASAVETLVSMKYYTRYLGV
ncbi:hypothetical protein GF380_05575 [Candidatus Uhrbacteria bacterium]|nr:hypothetical protein [Candidatus Uhrbacteria bacterium]